MLEIKVPIVEAFDNKNQKFTTGDFVVLELEHSLVSLSKWESKHKKPFLSDKKKDEKTGEEVVDYVKCMCLTPDVPEGVWSRLSEENYAAINEYIEDTMTATWFTDDPKAPKNKETITAELIYYWMTIFQIPFECQEWHLNRLLTLVRICNVKSGKPKKMSRSEIAERNRQLNAERKAQLKTKG